VNGLDRLQDQRIGYGHPIGDAKFVFRVPAHEVGESVLLPFHHAQDLLAEAVAINGGGGIPLPVATYDPQEPRHRLGWRWGLEDRERVRFPT
jgi:hypothetical protein